MRNLLSAFGLLALVAGSSGCIINANGNDTADMKFDVTFAGVGCHDAGVASVQMTFDSGAPQTFDCNDNHFLGVLVPNVAPGTYRVTFAAFDSAGNNTYGSTGDFVQHSGGSELAVDLPSTTEVVADFTFAGLVSGNGTPMDGMTCAEAQIASIHVKVDGTDYTPVSCTNQGRDAATLAGVGPGTHTFVVDAYDSTNRKLYSATFPNLQVQAGSNEFTFDLLAIGSGAMDLAWSFDAAELGCGAAGVSYVDYTLTDQSGAVVYDTQSDQGAVACASAPAKFSATSGLNAGVYTVTLYGENGGGSVLYEADNVRVFAPVGFEPQFTINAPLKQ